MAGYGEMGLHLVYLMDKIDATIAMLRDIRALRCTISIDDSASGNSSLGHLKCFPIDELQGFLSQCSALPIVGPQAWIEAHAAVVASGERLRRA